MALVGITAHLGLFQFGRLQPGEVVYVPGGSGGVGSMVVQMAKAVGARVATSASRPEGLELCTRLGDVAGLVETDAKLLAQLMRSPAPSPQKADMLLRIATGEIAPPGPAADRAKMELMKLIKAPETRAELAASPDVANRVRELMAARRAVAAARKADDEPAETRAHAAVDAAKVALGERGPVWWDDGAPDLNRHLARTGPYAAWFAAFS